MSLLNHENLSQAFREAFLHAYAESLLRSPITLTTLKLDRRAATGHADDRIHIEQPLRNMLGPEDDTYLRDLGIEPPACNYSPSFEAWSVKRFTGTFEINMGLSSDGVGE